MENDQEAASTTTRPYIGFPLGFALLLLILSCMCCFFACYLHWHKIRSTLIRSFVDDHHHHHHHHHHVSEKFSALHMISEQNQGQSLLVSMPGDQVPKFVAMPCPCKPPLMEKLTKASYY